MVATVTYRERKPGRVVTAVPPDNSGKISPSKIIQVWLFILPILGLDLTLLNTSIYVDWVCTWLTNIHFIDLFIYLWNSLFEEYTIVLRLVPYDFNSPAERERERESFNFQHKDNDLSRLKDDYNVCLQLYSHTIVPGLRCHWCSCDSPPGTHH